MVVRHVLINMNKEQESIIKARALFESSIAAKQRMIDRNLAEIVQIAKVCSVSLLSGGKIMLCGNGGSAADAQHLAAELLVRLRPHVNRQAMPAISLAMDTSSLTATGNDYSFEIYFERMVFALGRPGDVLIGITTSGKSKNIVRALEAARGKGIITVGLLGATGQPACCYCDYSVIVPSNETGRIQECHITTGHAIMELIEDDVMLSGSMV
jgi:D-sedoheptulose 7-phosphate isomerase